MSTLIRAGLGRIAIAFVVAAPFAGCDPSGRGSSDGDGTPGADCAPDCTPTTLAHGIEPRDLAVDADNVYFVDPRESNDAHVNKVPRAGGDTVILATGGRPNAVVLDQDYVYWTDLDVGSVLKVKKTGGTVETVAGGESGLAGLAILDGQLFWPSLDGLRRVNTQGGAVETVADGIFANSNIYFRIAVGAKYAVWADNGNIFRAPRAGGESIVLRSGPGTIYDLAINGESVIFALYGSENGVYRVSIEGSTPELIAPAGGYVEGVAVDNGDVYWSDTDGGRIMGESRTIGRSGKPTRIVANGGSLFFVDASEAAVKSIGP
jgi:hypothetical protein